MIEVAIIIRNLKVNKATGTGGISPKVITLFPYFSETFVYIINRFLLEGIFPDDFKEAIIVPVHNSGDKKELTNYRPISLISTLAKVYERLIYNRIIKFSDKNNLINKNQFGFLKKKPTIDPLAKISSEIYKMLDEGDKGVGVFIDLKKAFDTVSHEILLDKLYEMGFRGAMHDLLKN